MNKSEKRLTTISWFFISLSLFIWLFPIIWFALASFKNPKNLEKVTRVFFNQRRKKLKTPFNILFKDNIEIQKSLNIDLNLRPHNLSQEIYYKLTEEYEKL